MIELLLLAFGLAADAFAVSIASGVAAREGKPPVARIALAFGLAQGVMPLLGALLAHIGGNWFTSVDHWLALGLLGFLGIRMVKAGLDGPEGEAAFETRTFSGLLTAAAATSIDAAAAGLTLPLFATPVWMSCLVIGLVTAIVSAIGAAAGGRIGMKLGTRAEIIGGLVLIGIGLRIFVSHMGG